MRFLFFFLLSLCPGLLLSQVSIVFNLTDLPEGAGKVGLRGNVAPLSWEESIWLEKSDEGIWSTKITFPEKEATDLLEYKYVLEKEEGKVEWELKSSGNRLRFLDPEEDLTHQWNIQSFPSPDRMPKISVEGLKKDLAILEKAFDQLHPGAYRYQSKAKLAELFDQMESSITQPLSIREAYLEISRITGAIKCGHTYANFWNQTPLVQSIILDQRDKLPFTFEILDDRMFITNDLSGGKASGEGKEIFSINGTPTNIFLSKLLPLVKADGGNDAKRYVDLEVHGAPTFEAFDVYFPLLYPPIDGAYEIEWSDKTRGTIWSTKVAAITRQERTNRLKDKGVSLAESYDDLWSFEILDDQVGYLKLGTFVTWKMELNWKQFLKEAFQELKEKDIPNLIVDIRGNEGGLDAVEYELRKYLVKNTFSYETFETRTTYDIVPEELRPYLSTWDNKIFDISKRVKPGSGRFFLEKDDQARKEVKSGSDPFQGKVYLIVDATNSSATFYLSRKMKLGKVATLVGQTTGGNLNGLNGGQMFFLRLPNSGIEVDIPLLGNFSRSPQEDMGLEPDFVVDRTVKDIIKGKDTELEYVLQLINN